MHDLQLVAGLEGRRALSSHHPGALPDGRATAASMLAAVAPLTNPRRPRARCPRNRSTRQRQGSLAWRVLQTGMRRTATKHETPRKISALGCGVLLPQGSPLQHVVARSVLQRRMDGAAE